MPDFTGFVFIDPKEGKEEKEKELIAKEEEQQRVNDLTNQFTFMQTDDDRNLITQRLADYKARLSPLSNKDSLQEKRRQEALDFQKRQRHMSMFKARQIASLKLSSDEEDEEGEDGEEDDEESAKESEEPLGSNQYGVSAMKRQRDISDDEEMEEVSKIVKYETMKRKSKKNSKKRNSNLANQIMLAETIETLPEDFLENWIMVICPKGKRCLVTSGGGVTIARSRAGFVIKKFQSLLPNGSSHAQQLPIFFKRTYRSNRRTSDFCILDCVYDKVHWTFYVLDIMAWNGHPAYDCDTSFRHFWLQNKIQPNELSKPNGENQFYKFKPIIPIPTTELSCVIGDPAAYLKSIQGMSYDIDGLLFYHRQALYQGGLTPLVNWLPLNDIQSFFASQDQQLQEQNLQVQQMEL
ncbi:hypothetical protein BDF20DRAFT_834156 [Mycotypha africana]|uniref:uncharacterized protein n=1 Tax=Mycotypha africana TaxID=64632 RepID=UPI002300F7CD|nr:uncharacterized protein BDF20DRAFT_834156 [Mycotypha africana]KAI8984666.1 hypothetical protein BDF20DRAFT_834156 [Mycotypha africana]